MFDQRCMKKNLPKSPQECKNSTDDRFNSKSTSAPYTLVKGNKSEKETDYTNIHTNNFE